MLRRLSRLLESSFLGLALAGCGDRAPETPVNIDDGGEPDTAIACHEHASELPPNSSEGEPEPSGG